MNTAEQAVAAHILRRVETDPRLAYYIGPFTESLNLLLAVRAQYLGLDAAQAAAFAAEFMKTLKTERPRCSMCECSACNPRPPRDIGDEINGLDTGL